MRDREAITQVREVRVNTEFPCIPKCPDLLWLTGSVLGPTVFYLTVPSAHLPVRLELNTVGGIEVDCLDLSFEPFLLGKRCHDKKRVAKDHPIRPVLLMVVEIHEFLEFDPVEVRKQFERGFCTVDRPRTQLFDDGLRLDLLLDVDGYRWYRERLLVLLVLALPHELRIEGWVARVEDSLRPCFGLGDEVPQLLRGN